MGKNLPILQRSLDLMTPEGQQQPPTDRHTRTHAPLEESERPVARRCSALPTRSSAAHVSSHGDPFLERNGSELNKRTIYFHKETKKQIKKSK